MQFLGNVFRKLTINRVKKKRYNDDELIEGLRQGDDAVLNFLYKNYYGVVQSLVCSSKGSEEQARDIFQEVIIVIYNKLQDSNFKITSSFFTFFYAVIKYTWRDFRVVNKRNPISNSIDFNDEIGDKLIRDDVEEMALSVLKNNLLNTHLVKLSKDCQEVLHYYREDYSSKEIAVKLDLKSAGNARKRKSNCLKTLMESIRKDALFKELL